MPDNAKQKSYPRIPTKNWWDLRRKFIQSQPKQVSPDYLQSVLGVQEGAASNLIPPLRAIGLIDDNEKPTAVANDWRSDDHYAQVCESLLENIYPQELRDALPGPRPERKKVEKWFMRNTGTGEGAAKQMAAFYLLLCEGDPAAQDEKSEPKRVTSAKPKAQRVKGPQLGDASQELPVSVQTTDPPPAPGRRNGAPIPSVHIDIQVHIAADASADQIDQVFASMAKHLYGKT